jgi:hypothetical protein
MDGTSLALAWICTGALLGTDGFKHLQSPGRPGLTNVFGIYT